MEIKKKIETEYSWFVNRNINEPNIAKVKVKWVDDNEPDDDVKTIVIDSAYNGNEDVPYINDSQVFYYVKDINELLELCETNEDFQIVQILGFEYLK